MLQSDLRVTEEISYRNGAVGQIVAEVVVGNANPVDGSGTLQAITPDGLIVGETAISIAGTPNSTRYMTATVSLDAGVSEDDELRFEIDPDVPDADPTTVSRKVTVGPVSESGQSTGQVELLNPTLSNGPVDSTPSNHTLSFTASNVSADDDPDSFSIELPETVGIEDDNIKEVNVTNGEYNVTPSVDGDTINFEVDPDSENTSVVDLDIEVDMTLSADESS